jgi:hypothetical protein
VRALTVGLNVLWCVNFALGHTLLTLMYLQQIMDPEPESLQYTIPRSAKEVHLVLLATFVAMSQARLWARVHAPILRGEYFLLLWSAGIIGLWCAQFFFGRPYPEEATHIVIGIASIYGASMTSTVMQAKRR